MLCYVTGSVVPGRMKHS